MAVRRGAVAGVVASASSVQVGAAFGATIFPLVGPPGVVAMRQLVAAIALLAVTRPPLRQLGIRRLAPAAILGVVLVIMNVSLYTAVQRIGLGLGVTIEFLGPLGVALAATRRWRDAGLGALALVGVVVLTGALGTGHFDPLGVLLGLVAAVTWAAYILLTQRLGDRLPGVVGTTAASMVASVLTLPILIVVLVRLPTDELLHVLGIGAITGVLSSALPYSLDLVILRILPRSVFGMLQSVHPVAATMFGFLVLDQTLTAWQLAGIAAVCVANVLTVATPRGPADTGRELIPTPPVAP